MYCKTYKQCKCVTGILKLLHVLKSYCRMERRNTEFYVLLELYAINLDNSLSNIRSRGHYLNVAEECTYFNGSFGWGCFFY
jgi:hypothetical protein